LGAPRVRAGRASIVQRVHTEVHSASRVVRSTVRAVAREARRNCRARPRLLPIPPQVPTTEERPPARREERKSDPSTVPWERQTNMSNKYYPTVPPPAPSASPPGQEMCTITRVLSWAWNLSSGAEVRLLLEAQRDP
jgi:hypothetical protein